MNQLFFYWLITAVLFLLFEIGHPGLFLFLSFSIGALFGAIISILGYPPSVQLLGAFGVSLASFLMLSLWIARRFKSEQRHSHRSNIDALVGKEGFVIATITQTQPGLVKIHGTVWSSKTVHGNELSVGLRVSVVKIEGVTLFVEKHEAQSNTHKKG